MEYSYKTILFQGSRRDERFSVDPPDSSYPVGQIICTVLGLEESFFKKEEALIERLESTYKKYLSNRISETSNEDQVGQLLSEWRDLLLNVEQFDSEEALLHRLFVFLPCYDAYSQVEGPMMRVLYNSKELAKVSSNQAERNLTDDEYEKNQIEIRKFADQYAGWNSFLLYLEDEWKSPFWSVIGKAVFGEKDGYFSYTELLKSCLSEIKRLKVDLIGSLLQNDKESKQLLWDAFPGPRIHMGEPFQGQPVLQKAGKYTTGMYTYKYEIVSFSELIRAELMILNTIDRKVHRCRICGKFFVPYRENANACNRKNAKYNGKTCSRVYSEAEYHNQHPELNTPVGKEYMRHYKAYSKWATEGMRFVSENAYILDEKNRQQTVKEINDEIIHVQDNWRARARSSIIAFSHGELSKDEVEKLITIPEVKTRSPLLAAFRRSVSEYKGN